MEHLFAPWRLRYIIGDREEGCVFCKRPSEEGKERENLILHVAELSFVILNKFPYNAGHLMIVPRRHTSDFSSLSMDENRELSRLLQRSIDTLAEVFRPEGFNVGLNLGRAAGAGIQEHLHWHVVPRWNGDTNFFPLFSDTRSVPQALEETWEHLAPVFERLFGADFEAANDPGEDD